MLFVISLPSDALGSRPHGEERCFGKNVAGDDRVHHLWHFLNRGCRVRSMVVSQNKGTPI